MKKLFIIPFMVVFALGWGTAHADDDDDLSKAQETQLKKVLATIGCDGWEEVEVEDNGTIEVEDAKCKMGTMDIKLNKNMEVQLISRF